MGFEPTRAEHIGLAVQRFNNLATSSSWRRLSPPCQSTTLKSHRVHGQNVPTPGVEPGPSGWKPDILAVRPRGNNMFSPGIEPGTFCVLDRCDNRYTTKTCLRGKEDIGVHILLVSMVMWSPVTAELDWCWPWHLLSAIVHSPMILTHGLHMCVSSTFWGL